MNSRKRSWTFSPTLDTMKRMGEAALTVVHENQGATERNIKAFEQLVAEAGVKLGGRHES